MNISSAPTAPPIALQVAPTGRHLVTPTQWPRVPGLHIHRLRRAPGSGYDAIVRAGPPGRSPRPTRAMALLRGTRPRPPTPPPPHTRPHDETRENKNRAREAVEENPSGAAGQPRTPLGPLTAKPTCGSGLWVRRNTGHTLCPHPPSAAVCIPRPDLALATAGSHVPRRELDLTAPDMGTRLVPTELWVRRRRILPSGTWDSADS